MMEDVIVVSHVILAQVHLSNSLVQIKFCIYLDAEEDSFVNIIVERQIPNIAKNHLVCNQNSCMQRKLLDCPFN